MEKKKTAVAARSYTIPAPSEQKTGTWSETATRVLRERYLLRDATGEIVETPDEMCWRVASAVAMAETQWTKDRAAVAKTAQRFYDMMVEHRFLPNSPTLMNAGKGNNLQLSACFPAGTMIATREGPVPIEDIQAGDTVLTDRGRYRPVVETMTRRDLVYRIKVDKLPTFEVTGEHPYFTQRGWVKAAELEPCADFVFIGTYTERHDADMGLPRISVRGVRVGEHIYHPISVTSSRYSRGEEVSQQIRAVTADVEVDEEIAWLLGYYTAEGSISAGYDLRFTANVSERALLERALDILQRRLNLTGSIYATERTTTHGEWLSARVHSKLFTEWLDIHFSHGFARKKLPAWLFDAPTSVISSFLEGVSDGDGTRMNATQIRITLSNEALVRQLFELLRIMGHAPCLSREYLPAHATTQAWSVTYGLHVNRGMVHDRADGAVAYRVRSVERVDDTPVDVYNLEVAEDHTYVANQIVVHNCYVVPVEDSLEGIFEAVKHAALIHQSGGGCISGDAHVFTTFCGVEAIETLYARVQETGYAEERRGDHAVIDVRDLNIRTMALNPADGGYEPAQVTHLWRYNVPLDDQVLVRAANGLEVTTSCWHPFMVFNGQQLVERRADSLRAGDILPTSNRTVRERWPHSAYREVAGVLLDEEIAWLLGYYLGDGNLGWAKVPSSEPRRAKLRWRLFDGRTASLEHARDILARRFSVHINIQCDARGLYCLATTDSGFIQRFRDLIEIYPGPKGELPFPEMVAKSPLSVVGAFLAGLVDSDGYVEANRDRVTVTTQSHHLASKVHTLASLLGLAPGLRSRAPQGKGKVTVYEVKLAAEPMIADLRDLIGPYINDTLKSERLAADARNHDHSTETRLSLPFSAVEDVLQSVGVVTTTTEIHRQPVHIGETEIWLHRWKEGLGVNSQKLLTLIAALRPLVANSFQSRLDVLERLARGATTVTAIERPETNVPFYDFTVADHSTYLAGVNGLTAIHNTGFSFSRLRPKGSIVGSTHGVASGPVSFMKIFDGATEAVKQGGCVIPETRVATSAGLVKIGSLGPLEAEPKSWHKLERTLIAATDEGARSIEEFYHNGVSEVRRVHTRHGYEFTGTPEHRVRVIDDHGEYVWRHLKDLREGEWVALQKHTYPDSTDYRFPAWDHVRHFNSTPISTPEKPTAELGEFIGYLIGDGSINYYNSGGATGRLIMTVADSEPDVSQRVLSLAQGLFGVQPIEHRKHKDYRTAVAEAVAEVGGSEAEVDTIAEVGKALTDTEAVAEVGGSEVEVGKALTDASVNYFFNSTELVTWLRHIEVTKESTLQLRVPEIVYRAGAEFARGFLRGLFTADGTISSEGYVTLYTVSEGLAQDTQQLLLALGIPSTVVKYEGEQRRKGAFSHNPLYRVHLITQDGMRTFAETIGFMSGAKNNRLDAGLEKAFEYNDVLPNQQQTVAAIYQGPGRGSGPERGSRGANRELYRDLSHYMPNVAAPRNLTRSRLRTLAERHEEVRNSPLVRFLTNNQFYDQVTCIEADTALTVDLSVKDNHTYVANGFVSHNTRRGANMGVLRIDHPDIEEFIDCKRDGSVTNFNISVGVTEVFMQALENDAEYELVNPHDGTIAGTRRAREIMDKIVDAAWATGDPGLLFLDRANHSTANPIPEIERLEATNPCGEQWLGPYDACNLGSINVGLFVTRDERGKATDVDWAALEEATRLCVRFLDDVIDINPYPLEEVREKVTANRRIGLGIMGWAEMLFELGLRYDSDEAIALGERLMTSIRDWSRAASEDIAAEREAFPNWSRSIYQQ